MTGIIDLGHFSDAVLICGGAYGNLEALEALSRWASLHDIPATNIIHTGDAVAYCADAAAASQFIRENGWPAIKGNVEEQLAVGADNCACGFQEGSICNTMSAQWFAYAGAEISTGNRQWMASLPSRLQFTMNTRRFQVLHGSVDQTNRFMFDSLDEAEFTRQFDVADCDAIVAGHTGLPFTRQIGNRIWHNSGALGMPANDGTPRVWISVISPDGDAIRFAHHALIYDHAKATEKLRQANLPQGYADGLETGLWPSLDILPEHEANLTGKPIALTDHIWQSSLARAV